jgi:hypothetical protein
VYISSHIFTYQIDNDIYACVQMNTHTEMPRNTIRIETRLFKRDDRVFVNLPKSRHPDLEEFRSDNKFVYVLLQGKSDDKRERKICSFAARIAKAKLRQTSYRMHIEIPLAYRAVVKDYVSNPITAILSKI